MSEIEDLAEIEKHKQYYEAIQRLIDNNAEYSKLRTAVSQKMEEVAGNDKEIVDIRLKIQTAKTDLIDRRKKLEEKIEAEKAKGDNLKAAKFQLEIEKSIKNTKNIIQKHLGKISDIQAKKERNDVEIAQLLGGIKKLEPELKKQWENSENIRPTSTKSDLWLYLRLFSLDETLQKFENGT